MYTIVQSFPMCTHPTVLTNTRPAEASLDEQPLLLLGDPENALKAMLLRGECEIQLPLITYAGSWVMLIDSVNSVPVKLLGANCSALKAHVL